ncbi:MAG: hypothetical protein HY040_00975 [Planctomycetes bacterium]|nr:hypothetical protein [Planctomycetota bacterium]
MAPSTTAVIKPGHASFIIFANKLDRSGHSDASLDLIYDEIDELLRAQRFADIDEILREAAVPNCSTDVLLAILTATAPAKSRLAARSDFFQQVKSVLDTRDEKEPGLLDGLEQ